MPAYSVIVPVYNRPGELADLLESLSVQTYGDFEVLVIDDGSEEPCRAVVDSFAKKLEIRYFYKDNTGPGDTRNYGLKRAATDFLIVFDSDCILPPDYFSNLVQFSEQHEFDVYGGPDMPHPSFTKLQRAIGHTMTSALTTGGIRGRKKALEKFHPRSFNMGMTRSVYEKTGGFSRVLLAEDTDLAIRVHKMGCRVVLVPQCYVYHKRRISLRKFFRQTHHFGYGRAILTRNHPDSFKLVFLLPASFLLYCACAIVHDALRTTTILLWPVLVYLLLLFIEAIWKQKNLLVALLVIPSALTQLFGYGYGTLKGFFELWVLRRSKYLSDGENPLKKAM